MSIEGVGTPLNQEMFVRTAQTQSGSSVSGTFMGHTVQVEESPQSVLADAAEELGFAVDTTKDFELSERKVKDDSISRRNLLLYRTMMQKVGQGEKMNELVEQLKNAASREMAKESLQKLFSDSSDAWTALDYALEELAKDPSVSKEQMAMLKSFAERYAADNAKNIRLGLQGAVTGQNYSDLGDTGQMKNLYQQTVGEFSSVKEVFTDIQKQFGTDFDRAMDFLFAAISEDIHGEAPSMEKANLQSLIGKLELVRLTQSAYLICGDVASRWVNVHHIKSALTAMSLLGETMQFKDTAYPSARDAQAILAKSGAPDIERQVLFLQELLSALKKFPTGLFDDETRRMQVLDAAQQALDEAIEAEDEYLSQQDDGNEQDGQ